MAQILPTNVCCLDVQQDCIEYLKSLGLNVFEGTLGSVFTINWGKAAYNASVPVLIDSTYPRNIQEYHVFIHDMSVANETTYILKEHDLSKRLENPAEEYLECRQPITLYDLRPYGSHLMKELFDSLGEEHKRISIVFVSKYHVVEYNSNEFYYHKPKTVGEFGNNDAWSFVGGNPLFGKRVCLVEGSSLSSLLFREHLDSTEYYRIFNHPSCWDDGGYVPDKNFYSLLNDESGNCISYLYIHPNSDRIDFVLPQVNDKARLLKVLFENVLFENLSEFFPDIEAGRWIHNIAYELPNEAAIREKIEAKKTEYDREIKELEKEAESIKASNQYLKDIISSSGDTLVLAMKAFLEYLGFENVIDRDSTLRDGELKEEDLTFEYNGVTVLMEVKCINGTSTDSDCSQIDKVVLRRIRKTKSPNYHGVYVVNNQKNVEPLKRQIPPFNETQIKDGENQERTMVYTAQLFSLYSDIENGYVSKDAVRDRFLVPGLLNVHSDLLSLGVPQKFFMNNTVLCFHLKDTLIQKGDFVFYYDALQRMVGAEVIDIHIDGESVDTVTSGEVSIKVTRSFPKSAEVFIKRLHCCPQLLVDSNEESNQKAPSLRPQQSLPQQD